MSVKDEHVGEISDKIWGKKKKSNKIKKTKKKSKKIKKNLRKLDLLVFGVWTNLSLEDAHKPDGRQHKHKSNEPQHVCRRAGQGTQEGKRRIVHVGADNRPVQVHKHRGLRGAIDNTGWSCNGSHFGDSRKGGRGKSDDASIWNSSPIVRRFFVKEKNHPDKMRKRMDFH